MPAFCGCQNMLGRFVLRCVFDCFACIVLAPGCCLGNSPRKSIPASSQKRMLFLLFVFSLSLSLSLSLSSSTTLTLTLDLPLWCLPTVPIPPQFTGLPG
mmetsp:Transcript_65304/g.136783  ORF Transcript_65304/g.136783 Transcript_65304/m.136783 type:complete len:99 (-) Transcript_65304:253-549(-)